MKLINKILEDFSTLDDVIATEVDDFQNPIHIIRLKEVMASYGIQDEVINPIIRTITEQDDDEDEEVTFKHDGKTRTITMKTARQYASDIKQGDDSEEKQAAVKAAKLDTKDTKKDKEDDSGKLSGDDYSTEKYLKPNKNPLYKMSKQLEQRLGEESKELIAKDSNEERRVRSTEAVGLFQEFFKSGDAKRQVEIINELIDNRFITTNTANPNQNQRKVYFRSVNMSPEIRRLISTTKASNYMWDLAYKNGIKIEMDDSTQGRREAKYTGNVHEVGTADEISKLTESENVSKQTIEEANGLLDSAGGNVDAMKKINQKGAKLVVDMIKKEFGDDAKIVKTNAIGEEAAGSGLVQGDPTDVIVTIEKDGQQQDVKLTLKAYKNPSSINMKNAGVGNVGKDFFNSDELQKKLNELNARGWNFGKSDDKIEYQQSVYNILGEELLTLSESDEGQKKLNEMWKKVHGCGANVHALIANKTTGDVVLRNPQYYCGPPEPIRVVKKGKSISIEVGSEDGKPVLVLVTKTEKKHKNSGVLIFSHKA